MLKNVLKYTVLMSSILTGSLVSISVYGQNSFPISYIIVNVASDRDGFNGAEFRVPDQNTTVSAGGGLRRYDAHVAKMFEITHYECESSAPYYWRGISWDYKAGDGNIDMGRFDITCQLAKDIAIAYGLGKTQPTTMYHYRVEDVENIPTLNITGNKVNTWLNFVQGFRPRR